MNDQLPAHATVSRHFSVSAEDVFDAWLNTAMVGRFMFGPEVRDEKIVSLHSDPKVGGSFSYIVRREEDQVDHIGEYTEINRPLHLAFTWAVRSDSPDHSEIVIDIIPNSTGAELTLTQKMPANWAHFVESAESSWTKMLDALDKIL
ncbi:SRPBCC domain-containing protein [Pedobacter sp. N36a]|uniref:SRPBCC family protein n=1 Tax=Pedobacter sp. N36a TaxID=2767996 RepID=UPI0016572251|nr:SRPBCC family protein [Pedobacter sp. N36a]MBC8988103.1 SRPBCC domain-containing protein [Pedobacter sp. N36a]